MLTLIIIGAPILLIGAFALVVWEKQRRHLRRIQLYAVDMGISFRCYDQNPIPANVAHLWTIGLESLVAAGEFPRWYDPDAAPDQRINPLYHVTIHPMKEMPTLWTDGLAHRDRQEG